VKNTQDPYLAHQLSVFSPQGVTQMSKLVCVFPLPDGDARKTQRRPYVQRGGMFSIILHLSACTGANTSWCCDGF